MEISTESRRANNRAVGVRITLVISMLSGGGAERVATNIANYWAAKGWEVTILTTDFGGEPSTYGLHPSVTHLDLRSPRFDNLPTDLRVTAPLVGLINACSQSEHAVLNPLTPHILKLRRVILSTRPAVAISHIYLTNICVLSATRGLGLPVIVTEHIDPNETFIGEGLELLRYRLYPQANYVVVLTEESLGYFSSVPGIRGRIIPNAVSPPVFSSSDESPQQKNGKTLLAMGRLEHEKGFDLLLSAFGLVAEKHSDWTLEILGEGRFAITLKQAFRSVDLESECECRGSHAGPLTRCAAPICSCCRRWTKALETYFSKRWPAALRS
jgi:glycosyltransferase involved in cell wall biosynthesis